MSPVKPFSLSSFVNNLKPLPRSGTVPSEPIIRPVVRRTGELAHSISKEVRDTFERRLPGTNSAPSSPSAKRGRDESFKAVVTGRPRANSTEGKRSRTDFTHESTERKRPRTDSTHESTIAQSPAENGRPRTNSTPELTKSRHLAESRGVFRETVARSRRTRANSAPEITGTFGWLRKEHPSLEDKVDSPKTYPSRKVRESGHFKERTEERGIDSRLILDTFTGNATGVRVSDYHVVKPFKEGNAPLARQISIDGRSGTTRVTIPYHQSESGNHITVATAYHGTPSGILKQTGFADLTHSKHSTH